MSVDPLLEGLEKLWARINPNEDAVQSGLLVDLDPAQRRYEQVECTRLRIGRTLARDLDLTRRLASDVLALLPLDGNLYSQLIFPLVAAVGRRRVLEHLIPAVREGDWPARANASCATYWVRVWSPGKSSAERHIDHVADLWPELWRASLEAFVHCPDLDLRMQLHTAFPLGPEHYPPEAAPLLHQARSIAQDYPERFSRLLTGSTGYGVAI
ncbi:hypothetical protein ACIGXA_33385 [Streptomyces fildesensis]|uniref:Uncharacterized protein n=1 Tax=Streptomyces fildesensis TaxID=375757 RepID=A0ABW8CJ62_9ACTN